MKTWIGLTVPALLMFVPINPTFADDPKELTVKSVQLSIPADLNSDILKYLDTLKAEPERLLTSKFPTEEIELAMTRPNNTIIAFSQEVEDYRKVVRKTHDELNALKSNPEYNIHPYVMNRINQQLIAHRKTHMAHFVDIATQDLTHQLMINQDKLFELWKEQLSEDKLKQFKDWEHKYLTVRNDVISNKNKLLEKSAKGSLEYKSLKNQIEILDSSTSQQDLKSIVDGEHNALKSLISNELEQFYLKTADDFYKATGIDTEKLACIGKSGDDQLKIATCIEPKISDKCVQSIIKGDIIRSDEINQTCGEKLPKPVQDALKVLSCEKRFGSKPIALGTCILADKTPLGKHEVALLSCAASSSSISECIEIKGLNEEGKIITECLMKSGGNPKATAACAVTKLTSRELDKCFDDGIGGDGCFGDNNIVVQALSKMRDTLADIVGENNEIFKAHDIFYQNVVSPGKNHEVVRAFNDLIKEGKNIENTLAFIMLSPTVFSKSVTDLSTNIDRELELTQTKQNIDRELTQIREEISAQAKAATTVKCSKFKMVCSKKMVTCTGTKTVCAKYTSACLGDSCIKTCTGWTTTCAQEGNTCVGFTKECLN